MAEARDENRDTRQGCSTASVPPLKSNRNVGKATWFAGSSVRPFLGAWAALASGLLFRFCVWVWSRRVPLGLLRCLVSSSGSVSFPFPKRGHDPGQRPKDRSFGEATAQGPIFRQVSPSTYDLIGRGTAYWVFIHTFSCRFFLRLFLRTPSSRFRPTGRGLWKSLHVQRGLSVEVAPLFVFFDPRVSSLFGDAVASCSSLDQPVRSVCSLPQS